MNLACSFVLLSLSSSVELMPNEPISLEYALPMSTHPLAAEITLNEKESAQIAEQTLELCPELGRISVRELGSELIKDYYPALDFSR
jgi:hypothetical protein